MVTLTIQYRSSVSDCRSHAQVEELVSKGLEQDQVCVLAYYAKQVQRIRHTLRGRRLGRVRLGEERGGETRGRRPCFHFKLLCIAEQ